MPMIRKNGRTRQKPSGRNKPKTILQQKTPASGLTKQPKTRRTKSIVSGTGRRKTERRISLRLDKKERRHRIRLKRKEKQKLKQYQVNRLRLGKLVAVCANCGASKYRGSFYDTGVTPKEWGKISTSIKNHKGKPNLSHGICGTCVRILYPDIAEKWESGGN
ncbi:MAG: hypothetical protein ABIH20_02170 [Candidatus Diapherotrites archaeon]